MLPAIDVINKSKNLDFLLRFYASETEVYEVFESNATYQEKYQTWKRQGYKDTTLVGQTVHNVFVKVLFSFVMILTITAYSLHVTHTKFYVFIGHALIHEEIMFYVCTSHQCV